MPVSLLDPLRSNPGFGAVLLDFDGTLAPIEPRPEDARPAPGAEDAVRALVPRFALVAVVSGRTGEEVAGLLAVDGVRYVGLYGMEPGRVDEIDAIRPGVEALARNVPGAWVEDKGILAIHYRQAPDPTVARRALGGGLADLVAGTGLEVIEGKMVIEVVPAGERRKGGAVERLVVDSGVRAALYAGDDVADVEAFRALDRLADDGLSSVKVAVSGAESPPELLEAADLTVAGPPGLVELLRELGRPGGTA